MVAAFLTIDIIHVRKCNLNLNEYLTLLKIQHDEDNESFPYIPDGQSELNLVERRMVKWDVKNKKYILDEGSNKVFGTDDLFEEFYKLFPNRVETNVGFRVISAVDPESISAQNTKNIWKRITKGKPTLQRKIIDCLKKELESRKLNNSMAYLQNIDTWLRQATWEKWEDIPEEKKSSNYTKL